MVTIPRTALSVFEKYTSDEGEHTPRILPCSHTLCQKCIHHMLRRDTLECPECRVVHAAENDVLSFPQNKYICANITKGRVIPTAPLAPPVSEYDSCAEHERDLSLYCKGAKCQKPVCEICLINEHRTHDVIDIRQYGLEEEESQERDWPNGGTAGASGKQQGESALDESGIG